MTALADEHYVFVSAQYANGDRTSAVALTVNHGAILISSVDSPDLWGRMLDAVQPTPFAPPAFVPPPISDRQFAQGLAVAGIITEAEAEDWVGPGIVPSGLMAFVESLPAADQFAARMILRGATQFERAHPLTSAFGAMFGWSSAQIDQFWLDCAKL